MSGRQDGGDCQVDFRDGRALKVDLLLTDIASVLQIPCISRIYIYMYRPIRLSIIQWST